MAAKAAIAAFNERALVPSRDYPWEDYGSRMFRYAFNEAYYNNIVYRQIASFSVRHKQNSALYKHVRGVYNPASRLVDFYPGKVYGGSLDFVDAMGGAIPLVMADDALREAIKRVWLHSNWAKQKSLFVRYGAMLGDSALWIADDRQREKVRMEVLHPGKIKAVTLDDVGNVKAATLEYAKTDPTINNGREFLFSMTVDQQEFATFKDGKPWAFFEDMGGQLVPEWPNDYGFVPLVLTQHRDTGHDWGAAAFHHSLGKIDELNDAASILNDSVRKSVNVMWALAAKKDDVSFSGSTGDGTSTTDPTARRDKAPFLFIGKDGKPPTAMVPNINISAALENIRNMLSELERDMPELKLHRLSELGGNLSGVAIRNMYSDASDKITEARGNYDEALVRAHKMCVSIGGLRRYDGFQTFGLDSFERGKLDHYIAERPIFEDALTKQERLTVMTQVAVQPPALQRLMLEEMEVSEKKIKEVVAEAGAISQQGSQIVQSDVAAAEDTLVKLGLMDLDEEPEAA